MGLNTITPKDINPNQSFMGSVFQNSECETILRNIIMLQRGLNMDAWTPFSCDDYRAFCTHRVSAAELHVLNVFVEGGKAVPGTSTYQEPGWLAFDGEKYSFTPKMISLLERDYSK